MSDALSPKPAIPWSAILPGGLADKSVQWTPP